MASVDCEVCGTRNTVSRHERGKKDCKNCASQLPEPVDNRLPQRQTDTF